MQLGVASQWCSRAHQKDAIEYMCHVYCKHVLAMLKRSDEQLDPCDARSSMLHVQVSRHDCAA